MAESIQMFIATGILLVIALLIGIIILMIATVIANKATQKTTLQCPYDRCKYNKNSLCIKTDVVLKDCADDHIPLLWCGSIETSRFDKKV
jgi:hypothetical protein